VQTGHVKCAAIILAMAVLVPAGVPGLSIAAAVPSDALLTPEQHWAKGEVKYGEGWAPIEKVFQDYLAAKEELKPLDEKLKAARGDAAAIQLQMNNMKNDNLASERPIRTDMGKANVKRRELAKAAEALEPPKPQLQAVPPQPRDYSANIRSTYSSGNSNNAYDDAMRNWRRQADAVNRANDAATKKYQADLAAWRKARDDAKNQLPKVDQQIKDLDKKLEQSAADLTVKQAPFMEKYKAANEEAGGIMRKMSAVETRVQAIVDALKSAPETMRLKHGIAEWEGEFVALADLEKTYTATQAEIDRVRAQLKADAQQAGRAFPTNWRHPQQDRMDAMKALLDKAKAAAAAG